MISSTDCAAAAAAAATATATARITTDDGGPPRPHQEKNFPARLNSVPAALASSFCLDSPSAPTFSRPYEPVASLPAPYVPPYLPGPTAALSFSLLRYILSANLAAVVMAACLSVPLGLDRCQP